MVKITSTFQTQQTEVYLQPGSQIVGAGWPAASLTEPRRTDTILGWCCSSRICSIKETYLSDVGQRREISTSQGISTLQ